MMKSLNEIGLIPTVLSDIEHRSDVNPYYPTVLKEGVVRDTFGKLPIFVSPMTCILNGDNFKVFNESRVIPIMPRSTGISDWVKYPADIWYAVSLDNFKEWYCNEKVYQDYEAECPQHILIDVANGHMKCIYDYVKEAKSIWGNKLIVMIGNIANPDTYLECCKAGVDYVRVGIGGGNACLTSCLTSIHASMVWLLTDIQKIKKEIDYFETEDKEQLIRRNGKSIWERWQCNGFRTKIIADGGIDTIDKAIKCLALGADFVMMGKLFAQCEEACGEIKDVEEVDYIDYDPAEVIYSFLGEPAKYKIVYKPTGKKERKYYGMASEQGQKDISGGVHKNAEGIETWVPVKYTLNEFLDKFEAALRSCMSYCGAHNLKEFIGKVHWESMTEAEFKSYYK